MEVARGGHNARMDDPAYPLAMADRAFAYDGSFRTPDAMSAANRAAYGLNRNPGNGVPQRDAESAARSVLPPTRAREPVRRPSLPYVLFVSAAGCTIRAMVWRGRVSCEGVRRCPISKR